MLYLLDANVLIRAHNDYYPIDRVFPFWEWLVSEAAGGHVKIPYEIYYEIADGNDKLADWINRKAVRNALRLEEEVDKNTFNKVVDQAYAHDLTDTELKQAGRDPFLVSYAFMAKDRCVVTKEVSKPSKLRGRRKVPDACDSLKIRWMTDFRFYQVRGFKIP